MLSSTARRGDPPSYGLGPVGRFASAPPARATVQVSALPKGARVEIDAIAKKR